MLPATIPEILRDRFGAYREKLRLPAHAVKAAVGMMACRTSALGAFMERCPDGHYGRIRYKSCRGGSCPNCRFFRRERCIENHRARMLDTPHFHCVFTTPEQIRVLWRYNERELADIQFKATAATLKTLLADDEYLGATPGFLVALHTWGQQLQPHYHTHVLVTGGGLDSEGKWRKPKKDFLLPFRLAQDFFRGAFLKELWSRYLTGRIKLPPDMGETEFLCLMKVLREMTWHVEIMERYEHADGVLNYLARYVRGGPIGNSRIVDYSGDKVTFTYVDNRDKKADTPPTKHLTLHVDEFISRVLMHVPPDGLKTFRGYGLYANTANKGPLPKARQLLGQGPIQPPKKPSIEPFLAKTGAVDESLCPVCGKKLVRHNFIGGIGAPRGPPIAIRGIAA
jgi:hypothetical protein